MGLTASNETITGGVEEEIIKIHNLDELKQHIAPDIDTQALKDLFDFKDGAIETSKQELTQLREQFIKTGNLEAVKGFLERAKNSILEKTKKSVGGVKRAIEEGNRIEALSQRDGIEDGIEAGNVIDSQLEGIKDTVDKLGDSEAGKKVKEATNIAKKAAKEVGVFKGFDYIIDKIKSFGGWIGELIASIYYGIKKAFGFGDKAEKAKEVAEKALSPEEIEKTRENLQILSDNFIETANKNLNKYGIPLTEKNKKQLNVFIKNPENFTKQDLINLNKAFTEGKINKLSDISKYLVGGIDNDTYKKLNSIIFNKEQISIIKNAGINTVEKSIENEFGIKLGELKGEQRQALRTLIKENGVQENFIELVEKYDKVEKITFGELIKVGLLSVPHMAIFTFELIKIIPIEGIFRYFTLSITKLFELSRTDGGDLQDLILKKLETLSTKEKNMIFGIMMRKGMFAMNIIDKLTFMLTRTISESIISGHGNVINNIKVFGGSNYTEQKNLFDKFMKSLGQGENIKVAEYIKNRMETLNTSIKNASEISEIMKEIKGNPKISSGEIKLKLGNMSNNTIAKKLLEKSINSVDDLKRLLGAEISNIKGNLGRIQGGGIKGVKDVLNKGGFGIDSELNNLLKKQEGSLKIFLEEWERSLGQNGGNLKFWRKFIAIRESMRFSHDMKNIEIHVDSLKDGATKLEQLKAMQIESPKLFGSLFGTIATGLVITAGLSTKEDNTSILKHIYEVGKYVIPTIGPIQVLLNDNYIQKADTIRNSIKFGSETAAMGVLLTMDAAYITQTLVTEGIVRNNGKGFFQILKYHGQIVTAPWDFGKAVNYERLKFTEYKNASGKGLIDFIKSKPRISKEVLLKIIKKPNVRLILIALGALGISYFTESTETKKINELKEKGLLDENLNPILDNIVGNLSAEDKKFILEYMVWGDIEGIKVEFSGNNITTIYSSDKDITTTSLLYTSKGYILPLLEDLGINTDADYFKIKYINK